MHPAQLLYDAPERAPEADARAWHALLTAAPRPAALATLWLALGGRPKRLFASPAAKAFVAEHLLLPVWLLEESQAHAADLAELLALVPPEPENKPQPIDLPATLAKWPHQAAAETDARLSWWWQTLQPLDRPSRWLLNRLAMGLWRETWPIGQLAQAVANAWGHAPQAWMPALEDLTKATQPPADMAPAPTTPPPSASTPAAAIPWPQPGQVEQLSPGAYQAQPVWPGVDVAVLARGEQTLQLQTQAGELWPATGPWAQPLAQAMPAGALWLARLVDPTPGSQPTPKAALAGKLHLHLLQLVHGASAAEVPANITGLVPPNPQTLAHTQVPEALAGLRPQGAQALWLAKSAQGVPHLLLPPPLVFGAAVLYVERPRTAGAAGHLQLTLGLPDHTGWRPIGTLPLPPDHPIWAETDLWPRLKQLKRERFGPVWGLEPRLVVQISATTLLPNPRKQAGLVASDMALASHALGEDPEAAWPLQRLRAALGLQDAADGG